MEVMGLAAGEYGQSADKPEKRSEEQYQTEHTKNLNIFSKGGELLLWAVKRNRSPLRSLESRVK